MLTRRLYLAAVAAIGLAAAYPPAVLAQGAVASRSGAFCSAALSLGQFNQDEEASDGIFAVVENGRQVEVHKSLHKAVAAAPPGGIVEISGSQPYQVGHVLLDKPITLRAAPNEQPILEFELGYDELGLLRSPTHDPDGRFMFIVRGAPATIEGLHLRMDPPPYATQWGIVGVFDAPARLLNCSFSHTKRRDAAGVVVHGQSDVEIRNCQFVGTGAAVLLEAKGTSGIRLANSLVFGPAGIEVRSEEGDRSSRADLVLRGVTFQGTDLLDLDATAGDVNVAAQNCVIRADWVSSQLFPVASARRTWQGSNNLFDVSHWLGVGGQPIAHVVTLEDWRNYWGTDEENSQRGSASFATLQRARTYSHSLSPAKWRLSSQGVASEGKQDRRGINTALVGPGRAYARFRQSPAYALWEGDAALGSQTVVQGPADGGENGTGFASGALSGIVGVLGGLTGADQSTRTTTPTAQTSIDAVIEAESFPHEPDEPVVVQEEEKEELKARSETKEDKPAETKQDQKASKKRPERRRSKGREKHRDRKKKADKEKKDDSDRERASGRERHRDRKKRADKEEKEDSGQERHRKKRRERRKAREKKSSED